MSITVKGMNCNHCKNNAEASILKVPGVDSVDIDLPTGKATIHGTPDKAEILKAIESIGFTVVE